MNKYKLYLYHKKFFDSNINYDDYGYCFTVGGGESKEEALEYFRHRISDEEFNLLDVDCIKEMYCIREYKNQYLFSDGEYYRIFKFGTDVDYEQHPYGVYSIEDEQITGGFPSGNEDWEKPTMNAIKFLERKRKIKNILDI